jgi:cobalt/nickel transport system permease protein
MHIPENYISPESCAVTTAVMAPVWYTALKKLRNNENNERIPLLGIGAAFSFLIMMFNLPLPGGTTGHAVGSTLIALLLGPWNAVIAVSVALLVQALFFGDGGILAFPANALNLAFIMPFVGYYCYQFLNRISFFQKYKTVAAFFASYISLNVAALVTATELGIQPLLFTNEAGQPLYCPYSWQIAIPAMVIPHLLVAGVAEGLITSGVLKFIHRSAPELSITETPKKLKPLYIGLIVILLLVPLGLLAEGTAWGEWGAEDLQQMLGYVPQQIEKGFSLPVISPDYTLEGVHEIVAYLIAATGGVAFITILFKLFKR